MDRWTEQQLREQRDGPCSHAQRFAAEGEWLANHCGTGAIYMTTTDLERLCRAVLPEDARVQVDASNCGESRSVDLFVDLGKRKLTVSGWTCDEVYRAFYPMVEVLRFSTAEITLEVA